MKYDFYLKMRQRHHFLKKEGKKFCKLQLFIKLVDFIFI